MVKKIVIFLLLISFVGCTKPVYKNKFVISGTYLEVTSPHKQSAAIVYREFKRLNKIFNPYDRNSEISRLNRTYNTPFIVSPEMLELLKLSIEGQKLTGGYFDVTRGALYGFWKGLIKKGKIGQLPSPEQIENLKENGGIGHIDIDYKTKKVTIRKKGLKIDLSAAAKGYMVDKAVQKLKENGIDSALINAGGDIYCLGYNKGRFWRVGLKNPREFQGVLETQDLLNEAVATSGNYEQFFKHKGRIYSHLIDPLSGYPVENKIISVTVVTANCTTADIMATGFFVAGLEGIKKFLENNHSTMRIFVLLKDGNNTQIKMFE